MPSKVQGQKRSRTACRRQSVELWKAFNVDDNLLVDSSLYQSVLQSFVSDDILLTRDTMPCRDADNDNMVLMTALELVSSSVVSASFDEVECSNDALDILLDECYDYQEEIPSSTPDQRIGQIIEFETGSVYGIAQEEPTCPTMDMDNSSNNMSELHLACQRNLQKLVQSMRRTDSTRAMVKRQRLDSPSTAASGVDSVFTCRQAIEVAETRQRIYQSIDMVASSLPMLS
jgi:hypothetical protein